MKTMKSLVSGAVFLAGGVLFSQAAPPAAWFKSDAIVGVAPGGNLGTWTNALPNGSQYFHDADWTHYPNRYYRVRSE